MNTTIGVSVIVPTFNDLAGLHKCLTSLAQQSYPKESIEIIVIDNSSIKSPISVVSNFDNVTFLEEPKPGSYAARNKGLSVAKHSIYAFTDSDCVADKNWIMNGVKKLVENPQAGLVAGKVAFIFADPASPTAAEVYDSITFLQQERYVNEENFAITANIFTRKDVMDRIGLFDSNIKSGGDNEWSTRVYKAGLKLIYAEDAVVWHPARHRFSELFVKTRRLAGGRAQLIKSGVEKTNEMYFIKQLAPPIKSTIKIFRNNRINGVWMKCKVSAIMVSLKYVDAFEKFRVFLGFSPTRS